MNSLIKNFKESKSLRGNLSTQNGWYTTEEFQNILKREKNRSNRSGLPISYIFLKLIRYIPNTQKAPKKEYLRFLEILITLLSNHTRDYDIKTLIDQYRIGILLIDTSLDGARAFMEKISQKFFDYFMRDGNEEYLYMLKLIEISSYPLNQIDDSCNIQGTPVVLRKVELAGNEGFDNNLLSLRQTSDLHVNWKLIIPSGDALVVDIPIFWRLSFPNRYLFDYEFLKRALDIFGSIFGLVFFSPLMILIALMIKISSRGPVLYKQRRIGYLGKKFTFLKFRTMYANSDEAVHKDYVQKLIEGKNAETNHGTKDKPLYKLENDMRITPIGRILRKLSLDELPQFLNVLGGSMSLVGPRPPIFYEIEAYKSWHHRRILEVKPGITGLWQVYGRSKTTFDEMVRLDLKYVKEKSIKLDIEILIKTFAAIFNTEGAL
jgi:lipopolysaccharide/colanic/teichoic acid biosynthesis glycosyltransferase